MGGVDALLLYLSVKTPHVAYIAATTAIAGSILGNLILFRTARYGVRRFASEEMPDGKRQKFRIWFQRYGLLTVFIPAVTPFVPLPLKVFVISAGAMHTPVEPVSGVICPGACDSLLRRSVPRHTPGRGRPRLPEPQRLEHRRHRRRSGPGPGRLNQVVRSASGGGLKRGVVETENCDCRLGGCLLAAASFSCCSAPGISRRVT